MSDATEKQYYLIGDDAETKFVVEVEGDKVRKVTSADPKAEEDKIVAAKLEQADKALIAKAVKEKQITLVTNMDEVTIAGESGPVNATTETVENIPSALETITKKQTTQLIDETEMNLALAVTAAIQKSQDELEAADDTEPFQKPSVLIPLGEGDKAKYYNIIVVDNSKLHITNEEAKEVTDKGLRNQIMTALDAVIKADELGFEELEPKQSSITKEKLDGKFEVGKAYKVTVKGDDDKDVEYAIEFSEKDGDISYKMAKITDDNKDDPLKNAQTETEING